MYLRASAVALCSDLDFQFDRVRLCARRSPPTFRFGPLARLRHFFQTGFAGTRTSRKRAEDVLGGGSHAPDTLARNLAFMRLHRGDVASLLLILDRPERGVDKELLLAAGASVDFRIPANEFTLRGAPTLARDMTLSVPRF